MAYILHYVIIYHGGRVRVPRDLAPFRLDPASPEARARLSELLETEGCGTRKSIAESMVLHRLPGRREQSGFVSTDRIVYDGRRFAVVFSWREEDHAGEASPAWSHLARSRAPDIHDLIDTAL